MNKYSYGNSKNHALAPVWRAVQSRCYNPKNKCYHLYGGRGITVCERWLSSFENFLTDMGERPSSKHQLDRIDNSLGYSPENCRWATMSQNANNKRTNRKFEYGGMVKTVAEWAAQYGLDYKTLYSRVNQYKWDIGKALTTPAKVGNNQYNN